MFFAEAKSQANTLTMFVDILYSIFDMCGMINFVWDVMLICND